MAEGPSFPHFALLPAEIRIKIWRYALFSWSIWTIPAHNRDTQKQTSIELFQHLTAVPGLIGRSCREAWDVLLRMSDVSDLFQAGKPMPWITFDRTILYIGRTNSMFDVMGGIPQLEREFVQHVIIQWSSPKDLFQASTLVGMLCHNVKTVIAQDIGHFSRREPPMRIAELSMDQYLYAATKAEEEMEYEGVDAEYIRDGVRPQFDRGQGTKVHLLTYRQQQEASDSDASEEDES